MRPRSSTVPIEGVRPGPSEKWPDIVRRVPAGVLVLAAVLFLVGSGMVLGGAYLAIARRDAGWMAWSTALILGPAVLYAAFHLLRLTRWIWLAMVMLLGLLLVSSLLRALTSPETPVSPLVEMAAEIGFLVYLHRPAVRRAFGRA